MIGRRSVALVIVSAALVGGCGKKGDPLPPLIRFPAAPADVVAERRASDVDIRFTVPSTNNDGSRPADIERVEVYAFTAPEAPSEDDLVRRGIRIGSLAVKEPRDPNDTIGPDDSDADLEPLVGSGLDQGAVGHLSDNVSGLIQAAGAPAASLRSYVVVGISTRGKRGLLSKVTTVPLTPAPGVPAGPTLSYSETSMMIAWPAVVPIAGAPPYSYHVYDVANVDGKTVRSRLTPTPLGETRLADPRIEFGIERCYEVTTVDSVDGAPIESAPSPRECTKLVDTFPPAPPAGLVAVQSEGAVNLSWDPSQATDLAGYIVLRGDSAAAPLAPLTAQSIQESTFRDTPPTGVRFSYAVIAVDRLGNRSAPSERVDAASR